MKMRTTLAVFAMILLILGALVGCGSGSSGQTSSASSASASASASPASSTAASASASDSAASASASTTGSAASASASPSASAASQLAKGDYIANFNTDSSMFHVNEADEGTGVLSVSDDGMKIHVRLVSKKIVNLYAGTKDEAQADAEHVIQPTTDTVTYSDGYEEEVYGFDIPVPAIDEEFNVAILGEKGTWYDHKVSVTNPIAQ